MRDRRENNHRQRELRLEQFAWQNRRSLTESEARLWSALRGRRLGVQFRRQVPLAGRYIADFCAPALRLVVEVDGGSHASKRRADRRRDAVLAELGYRVVRVRAELVMRDLNAAVAAVAARCGRSWRCAEDCGLRGVSPGNACLCGSV